MAGIWGNWGCGHGDLWESADFLDLLFLEVSKLKISFASMKERDKLESD